MAYGPAHGSQRNRPPAAVVRWLSPLPLPLKVGSLEEAERWQGAGGAGPAWRAEEAEAAGRAEGQQEEQQEEQEEAA